jgi:DNA-directed RNA polymerase subunit RPC12/RpoP
MQKTASLLNIPPEDELGVKERSENYTCSRCGNEFQKPIFAIVTSNENAEGYSACPRCLSKIQIVESPKEKTKESLPNQGDAGKSIASTCTFYAGYLKKRPKDVPVPEACFTCTEMLDCMLH